MNWAVVMAGGRGTRFWPESRNRRPKPFLRLTGKRTLLEETVERLYPMFPPRQILIVLQADLVNQAKRLLKRIPKENILGEPIGRNTAPCCVFAAAQISRQDSEAKFVFLPADQHVYPKSLFQKTLKVAFDMVDESPVLLGMRPNAPNTGFGYLEVSRSRKTMRGISYFTVLRFHEKPSLVRAKQFIKRGNFFWNGGTFVWRLDSFRQVIRKYLPRLYAEFDRLGSVNLGRTKLLPIYRRLPSISLDYGVMEKMRNVHCLLAPFEWSDLGGWAGLTQFWPADSAGNRAQGKVLLVKSRDNVVKANKRLVALLGVENLLVVDTSDALLICPQSRTEEIRDVVRELDRRKANEYL